MKEKVHKSFRMVEVFKTNIKHWAHAKMVIAEIHKCFLCYKANFDLEDCDRILRVECVSEQINPDPLVELIRSMGFQAEVLPDEVPVI